MVHLTFAAPPADAAMPLLASLSGDGVDAEGAFRLAGSVWPTGKLRCTRTRPTTESPMQSKDDKDDVVFEGIYHHTKLAGRYRELTTNGEWAEHAFVLRLATAGEADVSA